MQPNRDDLVPVFIPALVQRLMAEESKKGSPLNREEVEQTRDNSVCMLVTDEMARALDAKRQLRDISAERCWEDWQAWRSTFGDAELTAGLEFDRPDTASKMILCFPGPWQDITEFNERVLSETAGEYACQGNMLAQPKAGRQVEVDFTEPHPNLSAAFEIAGQGRIEAELMDEIASHQAIAYLLFDAPVEERLDQVHDFSQVMRQAGAPAIKIETTGIAHVWDDWLESLQADEPFARYSKLVLLMGDSGYYYSCGMQNFNLPDIEVPASLEIDDAAELMNQFNYWQIVESPQIMSGETFSTTPDAPYYRILHLPDLRQEGTPFQNPRGVWRLVPNS